MQSLIHELQSLEAFGLMSLSKTALMARAVLPTRYRNIILQSFFNPILKMLCSSASCPANASKV